MLHVGAEVEHEVAAALLHDRDVVALCRHVRVRICGQARDLVLLKAGLVNAVATQ